MNKSPKQNFEGKLLFTRAAIVGYDPHGGKDSKSHWTYVPVVDEDAANASGERIFSMKFSGFKKSDTIELETLEWEASSFQNPAIGDVPASAEALPPTKPLLDAVKSGLKWKGNEITDLLINEINRSEFFSSRVNGNSNAELPVNVLDTGGPRMLAAAAPDWEQSKKELEAFYDEIDLSADSFTPGLDGRNEFENFTNSRSSRNDDQLVKEFLKELFKMLFQDPLIIREFFCVKKDHEATDDNYEFDNFRFDASNISFSQYRVDSIIHKNEQEELNTKSPKTDGLYAYDITSKGTAFEDKFKAMKSKYWLFGYIPFIAVKKSKALEDGEDPYNAVDFLSRRQVEYDFQFKIEDEMEKSIAAYCKNDEIGWIFPEARNVSISNELVDNRLLFHWVGDSLGLESPLDATADEEEPYDENKDDKLDKLVADFIKEHLYKKKYSLPGKNSVVPLLDGKTYAIGLYPMLMNGRHIVSRDELQAKLQVENSCKEVTFDINDPINPPEIVLKADLFNCTKNSNPSQIILRHPLKGKRKKISEELYIAPPIVDFNFARWTGLFNVIDGSTKEPMYWVKRISGKVPDKWSKCEDGKIPYLIDNRSVNDGKLNIILRNGDSLIEESIGFSFNTLGELMSDIDPIKLTINSVLEMETGTHEYVQIFDNDKDKQVVINIPEGRSFDLEFGFDKGANRSMRVINAVSMLIEDRDLSNPLTLSLDNYSRTIGTEKSNKVDLKLSFPEMNYNIGNYYYLFRKYVRVFPKGSTSLPDLDFLLKRRKKPTKAFSINAETDEAVFGENVFPNDEDGVCEVNNSLEARGKKGKRKIDDDDILHIDNVFSLEEVFGEKRVEILRPKNITTIDTTSLRDDKLVFESEVGLGEYYFSAEFTEEVDKEDDYRAKRIDYFNTKVYSKHLQHYNEEKVAQSLFKRDLNASVTKPLVLDHGFGEDAKGVHIDPPRFEMDLLFYHEDNIETGSSSRKSVLMISFDKEELNLLSDQEYIGVDFNETEQEIGGKKVVANNTDLGVDFTLQAKREADFGINDFNALVDLTHPKSGSDEIQLNFAWNYDHNDFGSIVDGNTKYFKPLYLYKQDKAAIFINISKVLDEKDHDPFLKLSLCRAYKDDANNWRKSPTSKPKYMQLSSTRRVSVSFGDDSVNVVVKNKFESVKLRSIYFIAFYEGRKSREFETPVVLKNGANESLQFIRVTDDLVVKKGDYIIGKDDKFDPSKCRVKLFEFNAFDNMNKAEIEATVNKSGFNPFEHANFRLIFTSQHQ